MLKPLGHDDYQALIVTGDVNRKTGFLPQIEALVSGTVLEVAKARRGDRVRLELAPRILGTQARFWLVTHMQRVE